MRIQSIRNFCIIAHIDHGKSTLADRLLQHVGAVPPREFRDQLLDSMELERERGITIKASAVTFPYRRGDVAYTLNLIDTPGHVDFSYEVSRGLSACEGAILLVDAAQGVEAQTVANAYLAMEHDVHLIPVINKIDLAHARPDEVAAEMRDALGISGDEIIRISAKQGTRIDRVLDAIVDRIPAPEGNPDAPLRALVFDSVFEDYRGVITYIRLYDGRIRAGDRIQFLQTDRIFEVAEVGRLRPRLQPAEALEAGEVGYCMAGIRNVADVRVGDTIGKVGSTVEPLTGYRDPLPMVFCGLSPSDNHDFQSLRAALRKLRLNDPSFTFEPETSEALGFGFRCGFLGMLHMEIVQERLERESDLDLVQTAPSVTYEILLASGETKRIDSPVDLPPPNEIREIREPVVRAGIIVPSEYLGAVMRMTENRRGRFKGTEYLGQKRVMFTCDLPLGEIVYDFYDKLKSATRGYGTMDYELIGHHPADLVRLDILVAGSQVDALSTIVHRDTAYHRGKKLVERLAKEIDRHMFQVIIQAAIGGRIIARESLPALAKNVTAKLYGGDVTRKRKLLEKQKAGKKRMRSVGRVRIPQRAFLAVLQADA